MEKHYAYLGGVAAVLAVIGLVTNYFMLTYLSMNQMYGSYVGAALFIIGFILIGYGVTAWKWPIWLGSILVMIALIAATNALVLWFVFAVALGAITYSSRRPEIHGMTK
jgi:hypothetical protein